MFLNSQFMVALSLMINLLIHAHCLFDTVFDTREYFVHNVHNGIGCSLLPLPFSN